EMDVARTLAGRAREDAVDDRHRRSLGRLVELVRVRVQQVGRAPAAAAALAPVTTASPIDEGRWDGDLLGPPRDEARLSGVPLVLRRELVWDAVGLVVAIERVGDLVLERDDRVDLAA